MGSQMSPIEGELVQLDGVSGLTKVLFREGRLCGTPVSTTWTRTMAVARPSKPHEPLIVLQINLAREWIEI